MNYRLVCGKVNEQGTFTIWALGLCLTLFLLAGISIDLWRAFDARRALAEIADTAARAGASEINIRERQLYGRVILDSNAARNASRRSIDDNSALQSVSINSSSVDIAPARNEVNVEVRSTFSFFLLKLLPGAGDAEIVSRASARPFEG